MLICQLRTSEPELDPRVARFSKIVIDNGWDSYLIYWRRIASDGGIRGVATVEVLNSSNSLAFPPFWAIPFFLLLFYVRCLHQILKLRPNICIAHQLDTLPIALLARALHHDMRVVLDNEDVYSLMVNLVVPQPFTVVIRSLERRLAQMSDLCVFPNSSMRDYIGFGDQRKALIFPNLPGREFENWEKDVARRELKIGKSFAVGHFGFLRAHRGIESLIRSVGILRNEGVDILCLMTSLGPLLPDLQQLSLTLGVTKQVRFLGRVNKERIPALLSACDASAILHTKDDPMNWLVDPNKLYECMIMGIPIVGPNFGEIARIVSEYNCGLLVDPESPTEVAEALKRLVYNPQLAKRLGRNGIRAMKTYLSRGQYEERLAKSLQDLITTQELKTFEE